MDSNIRIVDIGAANGFESTGWGGGVFDWF